MKNTSKAVITSVKNHRDNLIKGAAVILGASAGLAIGLDALGRIKSHSVDVLADALEDDVAEQVVENLTEND